MIRIVLNGAPQGKGRPRFSRASGRAYTPAATSKYEAALHYAASAEMGDSPPLEGPLAVALSVYMPVPQSWSKKAKAAALAGETHPTGKPDLDNVMKMLDALNEVVWRDDAQIVEASIRKSYSDTPALVVEVRPVVDFLEV